MTHALIACLIMLTGGIANRQEKCSHRWAWGTAFIGGALAYIAYGAIAGSAGSVVIGTVAIMIGAHTRATLQVRLNAREWTSDATEEDTSRAVAE